MGSFFDFIFEFIQWFACCLESGFLIPLFTIVGKKYILEFRF